jgi:Tfp pilus assembly protein PilN
VKAVNLIPSDAQRGGSGSAKSLSRSPALVPIVLLAVGLVFVTIYVLTQNTISDRKAKIASDQAQLTVVKAQAAALDQYAQFEQLAEARIQTIRTIATSRFDWEAALSSLSKVVPANTSLQSLLGTVSPDANVSGTAGSGVPTSQSLRAAINAPAFAMTGCTKTHDDVARLISRLRLMDGVTRITLADSQKSDSNVSGPAVAGTSAQGCGPNAPTFDLVVFFKPLPGAAATTGSSGATSVSTTSTATTAGASSTPTTGTSTTTQQTTTTTAPATTSGPGAAR